MNKQIQDKLDAYFQKYKSLNYKKGEILIRADENPAGAFYLIKGHVKVYCISEKGDEVILNIFKPFSFFPMSWVISDINNVYFYEAMDDVSISLAPKMDVLLFVKNDQEVLFDLLRRLYKGVDGMMTRMTYLMSGSARTRLITEIVIAAKRFGMQKGSRITVNVSEKDLAMQAGLTRETVSREIGVLKKAGLITFNKKILEIIDVEKLTNEVPGTS